MKISEICAKIKFDFRIKFNVSRGGGFGFDFAPNLRLFCAEFAPVAVVVLANFKQNFRQNADDFAPHFTPNLRHFRAEFAHFFNSASSCV